MDRKFAHAANTWWNHHSKKKNKTLFHLDARVGWSKEILSIVNDGTNDVVVGILRKQEKSVKKISRDKEQHCILRKKI